MTEMPQNLETFLNQISFLKVQPDENHALDLEQDPVSWSYDWDNPHFGSLNQILRQRLEPVRLVPRMSTLTIAGIINVCVSLMPEDQAYLNIGTWQGFTLFAGMLGHDNKQCIGVDNFSQYERSDQAKNFYRHFEALKSPLHSFFSLDYQAYLQQHQTQVGVYFYDGEHSYEHQLQGLTLIEPFLAEGAIVLVDDTNWFYPLQATRDFLDDRPQTFEVIAHFMTQNNFHPTFWNGFTILRKRWVK